MDYLSVSLELFALASIMEEIRLDNYSFEEMAFGDCVIKMI